MKISKIITAIKKRWKEPGGYREMLHVAFPLIISTASWSVQLFVDRTFLTWYSPEAIAAAMPAGMLSFTITSLFMGTASYVGTFIAQYNGARQPHRIGPSLWQGLYVAAAAGFVQLALIPLAPDIFSFVGHEAKVMQEEILYFQILCLCSMPVVASSALAGFYAGLRKTWPVMWINITATAINLTIDYILIFGKLGFPEMGIQGAAIASLISSICAVIIYIILIFNPSRNSLYKTLSGWRLDKPLFSRLIKFGLPNGIQFFLEIAGFTIFVLLVGRLGMIKLAATNIAFNINTLAFMPMIGFGIAVSVTVGHNIAEGKIELAEKSVYSGFHLTFIYMTSIALMYIFLPELFLFPFALNADPVQFNKISKLATVLLKFVAIYCIFDTLNITFASAIKGAGDTRFVMFVISIVTMIVLVIPSYLTIVVFNMGIFAGWSCATVYIIALGLVFFLRFRGGKWKSMRVIEETPHGIPTILPEVPSCDGEL